MQTEATTPDFARRARVAVSAVFLVFGSLTGSWFPHIPDAQRQVGANYETIGRALLCSGVGAVVVMIFVGKLIHRFGSRPLTLVSATGACLLAPMLLLQTTIFGLCANLMFLGLCYGCLDVSMNAQSVHIQDLHEKPIVSGIHGWFSMGGIVGGATAALAAKVGLSPFGHMAAVSAVLLALLWFSYPHLLPASTDKDSEGPTLAFPKGLLLILGVICLCSFVTEGGILDWCALYVRQTLRAPAAFGGIVTATCSGALTFGRLVGDALLHRFGNRAVILLSSLFCVVGLVGAVCTPSIVLCIALFSLAGLGLANVVPIVFKAAGKVPGVPPGTALAAVTTCGYGGFLLGPPLIGEVAGRLSLGFAMGSMSLLALVVGVASLWVF